MDNWEGSREVRGSCGSELRAGFEACLCSACCPLLPQYLCGTEIKPAASMWVLPLHTHFPPSLESLESPTGGGPSPGFPPRAGTAPGLDPQTELPADRAAKRQKRRGGAVRGERGDFCFVSVTLQILPSYTPHIIPSMTFGRIWRAVTPSLLCCEFLPLTAHPNSGLQTSGREQPRLSASPLSGLLKKLASEKTAKAVPRRPTASPAALARHPQTPHF